jgi:CBS-domain-containing membrane protein
VEWFSSTTHYPLVIIPFATSIVLVIGSPETEPAQPRALVGLLLLKLAGPHA